MLREASWSRCNFFWGTFRCKRPNATLGANSGFDQPSMIVWASSRILELCAQLWKGCRQTSLLNYEAKEKRAEEGFLIMVLHLEVWIVSMVSAQATEEGAQIACDCRWFLSRGEVPAARKDCPALDVV
jgi:hypothetical protein